MTESQQAARIEPKNGFGITALVLAIIGLVFGIIPFTGFVAFILGALALLFALLGWGRVRRSVATNRKMNFFGGVLGVGAVALGIWGMVIVFTAVDELDKEIGKIGDDFTSYTECVDAIDVPLDDPKYAKQLEACDK